MADYAVSATRFMMNNKVSDDIRELIIDSAKAAISAISKVFKALTTKTALDTYKISQAARIAFRKEYDEMLERLSGILKRRSAEQIERLFQGAIIIIKHTERLVDHVDNISENFVFIKQSDFFFTKQSKQ
jgi:phosphate uptake regulator